MQNRSHAVMAQRSKGHTPVYWRRRYWADPEKSRAKVRAQREKHKEKRRAYDRKRYEENAERRAWQKQQAVEWARRNPGKRASIIAARRAWIKIATPKWLSAEQYRQMRQIYINAAAMPGERHVDHIVPLRGKTVCGLNVPWNMQILTGDENRKKSNRHAE